ncbi:hypothetical protein JOC85_001267 [Bacillus mesophilus]|nr:hypothetical protein [Bacillus mesophilus]
MVSVKNPLINLVMISGVVVLLALTESSLYF